MLECGAVAPVSASKESRLRLALLVTCCRGRRSMYRPTIQSQYLQSCRDHVCNSRLQHQLFTTSNGEGSGRICRLNHNRRSSRSLIGCRGHMWSGSGGALALCVGLHRASNVFVGKPLMADPNLVQTT